MPVRGSPRTGGDFARVRDAVATGSAGVAPAPGVGGSLAPTGPRGSLRSRAARASRGGETAPSSPAPLAPHAGPSRVPATPAGPRALDGLLPAPSPESTASSPLTPPTSVSSPVAEGKGKARAVERRVLPARIRRAAGRSEGIRELEEMVVDWLERYADVNTAPPESLQITFATLPAALVSPRPFTVGGDEPMPAAQPAPTREEEVQPEAGPSRPRIETPSFVFVKAGADDEEEARDEVASARARVPRSSPVKRLRHSVVGHDHHASAGEDTSDAYYEAQHRKFEVFERRQRIREREKLSFERYKMRARVDLLRSLPDHQWAGVVGGVLSRSDSGASAGWDRGRAKLAAEGVDWLRRRLVREGKEVLARYDQLLPSTTAAAVPDPKKLRVSLGATESSRPSTPSAASSASPPPRSGKARDEFAAGTSRRGRGRGSLHRQPSARSASPRKRTRAEIIHDTDTDHDDDQHVPADDSDSSSALSDPPSPPPEAAKKITLKLNLPRARARQSASMSASASPAPQPQLAHAAQSPQGVTEAPLPPPRTGPPTRSSPRVLVTPTPQLAAQQPPIPPPTVHPPTASQSTATQPLQPQPLTARARPVHKPMLVQTKLSFAVAPRPSQPAVPPPAQQQQQQAGAPAPAPTPPVTGAVAQPAVPTMRPPRPLAPSPPKVMRPLRQQPPRPPSPRVVLAPQPGGSILLEAARKRELSLLESPKAGVGSALGNGTERRGGTRSTQSKPFGMPLPASVERTSDFMLGGDEFLPIMTERKRAAEAAARRSLSHTASSSSTRSSLGESPAPPPPPATDEDVLDMEGVEEAVVL